jgi:colanic acid/amylovoran biosynthesis glycosyltransferase
MKLAVIVTEFPKSTETFILRDLMAFLEDGVDLRIYHLTPWRRDQILHDFAAPLAERTRHVSLFAGATLSSVLRHPTVAAKTGWQIVWNQGREAKIAAKSLALVPAALCIGEELVDWGADHVHAEFAGHPATAAWVAHHVSGVSYSVSCRAHDIFRSQRLLAQKFACASGVRTVSHFARRFIATHVDGVTKNDVEVIHSSVDVYSIPKRPRISGGTFRILYVGSLQPRKGVNVLLQALKQFDRPDWHLDIVGDGPDRQMLEAMVHSLALTQHVTFHGQRQFSDITTFLERASVCVAPSIIGPNGRTEGIPNVMIEALAYQRPAISSNVSGIPELIRPGETGWLTEPEDVPGLTLALLEVYDDPKLADKFACQGRSLVEREFDLRVNTRRQLDLFLKHRAAEDAPIMLREI